MRREVRDAVLVAVVAAAVHARAIWFGFVGLDDRDLIVDDQPFLARPSSVWRAFGRAYMSVVDAGHAYYRPLVTASYALDAQVYGAHAAGYHATNVVLHVVMSVLVWRLLERLSLGRGSALAMALLFAVHPVLSPAVAWIPGRNDALLGVFVVASWLSFLRGRALLHLALFSAALLTKETAIAVPLACIAHALLLEPALLPRRKFVAYAAAWVALMGARWARHPFGATSLAPPTLAWQQLPLLVAGFAKLTLYPRPAVLAVAQDLPWWPGVVAAAGIAVATFRVAGVRRRVVFLGAAVFVVFAAPPLLLSGTLVLDQRWYLPAVGVVLIVGEIVRAAGPDRRAWMAFAGVALVALSVVTMAFEGAYRDRRTFAREAVEDSPHSALSHLCLGQSDQLDGHDDAALAEYRAALSLGPAEVVHNNVAVIFMKRGLWADAETELRQELELNPRYARAQLNLAIVLRRQDRPAESCAAATAASRLSPDDGAIETERARDCAAP